MYCLEKCLEINISRNKFKKCLEINKKKLPRNKYFCNPFPVSSKILLKFFKINHRYHIDMSFHSLHHKKASKINVMKLR